MYIEKIKEHAKASRFIVINPPASDVEIQELKDSLGEIPEDLVVLLKEINGDDNVFLSAKDIIETNMMLRTDPDFDVYMPLDCLLVFAHNGCGDYYGYQIRKEGIDSWIFLWDHENDSRTWVARGLEHFITRYCNDEI